jgi:glycosyltransferase involved in cell wall biosynthesis
MEQRHVEGAQTRDGDCEGGIVPIVIPAYQPGPSLPTLIEHLLRQTEAPIIVVDDGSSSESALHFEKAAHSERVHVVRHAINLGKGAALKTGMNYALVRFPRIVGVVTADADGQHCPEDIIRVAARLVKNPGALVMGVRQFTGDVPLRSRIGNVLTRVLAKLLIGHRLIDTQTGLRGVPAALIPHLLRLQSAGYEFELDMLIACKHHGCLVVQEFVRTVYFEGNRNSHFHPIVDSMRIYFLLFRFSLLSLLTAALDNLFFVFALSHTGSIAYSQATGRLVAMVFNYAGVRTVVFHSNQRHTAVLPKYLTLVLANGLLSYGLIQLLHGRLAVNTITAKLLAEGILFAANFVIQRDFVFTQRKSPGTVTDWDSYYTSTPRTATLTRRYTAKVLLSAIKHHSVRTDPDSALSILEIGGANSCFANRLLAETTCYRYDVVDTNRLGLELLQRRFSNCAIMHLHERSVFGLTLPHAADVVFSIGLVEHFDVERTHQAVLAHFDVLRPGGTAIITFPTPTLLYRITRSLIETAGMWKFPDERPLQPPEVIAAIRERADILSQKTLWPLILTQHMVVARKRA